MVMGRGLCGDADGPTHGDPGEPFVGVGHPDRSGSRVGAVPQTSGRRGGCRADRRGERVLPGGARHEPDLEDLLELGERARQGELGGAEHGGCHGERLRLSQRGHGPQVPDLHVHACSEWQCALERISLRPDPFAA